ncbi:leucyl aminopeptidase [Sphingomonas sanguinis]|jgi:leucyl aminopeptidase|uniref:Probable cytosol aminopeptidase n=1 Tax=Sphingomonas sanguinis TaxID=33051 RepID=A0A7Y7QU81_9SPHN|nr:leucyl aminopeptidase [Sphingomonas sanguinis]MBZ6381457.1 leucyl aminopeptidase [Sphingomonas sanguinis]NNG51098.1 leucyl aminopeptidase [Sphingomonas sanguinis]NNG52956.1 leucyl aminopeptidase [Sphingomonas sanguinis]NVP30759.1 leucyl aminopeptidase [Sphingomonas sanguinis]
MQIAFNASVESDDVVVIPLGKDQTDFARAGGDGMVAMGQAAIAAARFKGEAGSVVEFFAPFDGSIRRIILLGIGSGTDADWRKAGGALTAKLLTTASSASLILTGLGTKPSATAVAEFAGAAVQRGWRHDVYRTKLPESAKPTLTRIAIVDADTDAEAAYARIHAVNGGLELTRTLVSEPPNKLYPETFVERVLADVEGLGLEVTVLDEAQMRDLGMGALLGVSQGSVREGRLLVLKWNGGAADAETLALVGKGVTFDTGGISIKPAAGMEDMKWDMGGAGAVAGAMKAIAARKAKANVVGVMGLVENMPDGNAQRPGDVVTSMSGQTIEVINTDAEGRLVLCDALTWVQKTHLPSTIVDLATLTGAMIISLGNEHGGLFANDDSLADALLAAGKETGEKLWRFPLSDAYDKLIDSQIADMKNVGPRGGGSITAAQFLKRYIHEGVAWAHLDIAGMVWSDKPGINHDKGATGYGVRLLDRFVAERFEA